MISIFMSKKELLEEGRLIRGGKDNPRPNLWNRMFASKRRAKSRLYADARDWTGKSRQAMTTETKEALGGDDYTGVTR